MPKLKVYKASAGSGKTYTIALEYIKELLLSTANDQYRYILAVTFTNDATGEMKERILAELYGLAFNTKDSAGFKQSLKEALSQAGRRGLTDEQIQVKSLRILDTILRDYSQLSITTIDSFFQKILRNLARELGRGSRFNIEMNTQRVRSEAVGHLIQNAHLDGKLINWLTTYVQSKLEEGGNWRIKNEILNFSSCIYDEFFQEHEGMMQKQLNDQPALFERLKNKQTKTIESVKTRYKELWTTVCQLLQAHNLQPEDFMRKGAIIKVFAKWAESPGASITTNVDTYIDNPEAWVKKTDKRREEMLCLVESDLMKLLKEAIALQSPYHTARLIVANLHQLGLVWYITNEIDRQNTENNRFMLSDTAIFLNKMIDNSDTPFIYEKIGSNIRHVMIDEFQDTSRLQWNNFKSLLSDILANNRFSMIVGDVKQSIYRWRNGDWRILHRVTDELSAKAFTLAYNYRSEPTVIRFNNTFFSEAGKLMTHKTTSELALLPESPFSSAYSPESVEQLTHRKKDSGYVSVDFLKPTEEASYQEVALTSLLSKLQELHATDIPPQAICLLTRTNSDIKKIADFLSSQKQAYPELEAADYLNVVSNDAFELSSSLSVKVLVEAMRIIADPDNSVYLTQLEYFLQQIEEESSPIQHPDFRLLLGMPLFELITFLYTHYRLDGVAGQSSYLFYFYDAVNQFLRDRNADIYSFLEYWDEELKTKTIPIGEGIPGIRAMTIHKSKGLQFDTVLIPYCTWELNPKSGTLVWCGKKEGDYDLELLPVNYSATMNETIFAPEYQQETAFSWLDNLNLLYVAFTRAERNLIIFGKYKKTLGGTDSIKTVSDLLQYSMSSFPEGWIEETLHFETGRLTSKEIKAESEQDNPLKQKPASLDVDFYAETFDPQKPIFKQSNKSRAFIHPEEPSKDQYVAYGNIMHELFARIITSDDISKAVDSLVFEGLILPEEGEGYRQNVYESIQKAGVSDWFDESNTIYSELSIIVKEDGGITTKRPDRVIIREKEILVIDYKFGTQRNSYVKQVRNYMTLLNSMGYENVKGFLWYVESADVVPVSIN